MTETQAHKFINRWKGILDGKEGTEIEIIGRLQLRIIISIVLSLLFAIVDFYRTDISKFWSVEFALLFCFSSLMSFRLRQARRALNKSQNSNG